MDALGKPDEEAETSRRAEEGIDEGQPPPHPPDKTYPKPEVLWKGVPDGLSGDVDDLLEEYRALWAKQLGEVDITPHRIAVPSGARPQRAQPFRASHASREVIAKEVQRLRDLGVIEPSSAEWAFPAVLVPKPDVMMRFCVDYRQLNEVTVRDVYRLPRLHDCIAFLGDAKVFSTLDCNSGYWQIPVADEDRDQTVFVCLEGAYRYIRLPFGLSIAPATFQWANYMILGGLKWKSCLVFLDDIIVFSQSAGEQVEHLREVFGALRGAGVSLKAKKCHLFQEEVEYLGHIVGRGQLQVQDKNVRRLKGASPTRCKKDLRSFLGMCSAFRRFVKDYAQVARPLAAMTSSKRPDRWGTLSDESLGALEDLKRTLTEAPILALPRRHGAYTLDTDASAKQVGAVLLQEQPDQSTRTVGYWSRSLNAAEMKYSTTERDCLAVVWASLLLRRYVEGTHFTVGTDHAALMWMLHMDGAHGRLALWLLRLAEFEYVVQTRPGASHDAADTMSRISTFAVDDGAIPDAGPFLALPNSSAAWQFPPQTKGGLLSSLTLVELLEGQAEDGRCKEVRAAMHGSDKSRFREDPYGLLVRTAPFDGVAQVYVPTHIRYGVMMREHYRQQAGHPGANKMYTTMRQWLYWESMVVDVYAFVANCTQCARNRVGKRRKTNYLMTLPPTEPLADLCMDLLGPIPRTASGK